MSSQLLVGVPPATGRALRCLSLRLATALVDGGCLRTIFTSIGLRSNRTLQRVVAISLDWPPLCACHIATRPRRLSSLPLACTPQSSRQLWLSTAPQLARRPRPRPRSECHQHLSSCTVCGPPVSSTPSLRALQTACELHRQSESSPDRLRAPHTESSSIFPPCPHQSPGLVDLAFSTRSCDSRRRQGGVCFCLLALPC
jgi:hypothetical protein